MALTEPNGPNQDFNTDFSILDSPNASESFDFEDFYSAGLSDNISNPDPNCSGNNPVEINPALGFHTRPSALAPTGNYEYESIHDFQSVRFIEIQPRTATSPETLHIRLFHSSLDDDISYHALSYVWGTLEPSESVTCNGRRLAVTPNLLVALKAVREQFCARNPVFLWVDAICINQLDLGERTAQVQLMRAIYSGAKSVLAWLGEEIHNQEMALKLLKKFHDIYEKRKDDPERTVRSIMQAIRLPGDDSPAWKALNDFLERPFTKRIWIVQEIVSAESCLILSGGTKLSYDWFTTALTGCQIYKTEIADYVNVHCEDFLRVNSLRIEARRRTSCDLLGLLTATQTKRSTDSRDKVYAVLCLSGSEYASRIVPDYQIPTSEVYQRVARLIISDYGNLDLLCAVDPIGAFWDPEDLKLPSWVPNWTSFGYNLRIEGFPYSAAASTSPSIIKTENPRILALTGYIVDNVKELGMSQLDFEGPDFEGLDFEGLTSEVGRAQLRNWIRLGFKATKISDDPRDILEAVAMTLVAGRAPRYRYPASKSDVDQRKRQLQGLMYRLYQRESFNEAPGGFLSMMQTIDISEYLHVMHVAALMKVFMLSSQGYIGLVPLHTKPGDVICILLGGQAPFILRPQGDEWQLIGAAYVHGMMYGELLRRDDFGLRDDIALQEFHIR